MFVAIAADLAEHDARRESRMHRQVQVIPERAAVLVVEPDKEPAVDHVEPLVGLVVVDNASA